MGFACGIVGLPNVGKSTLFNALSSAKAEAANFPFCTIEPNVGVVPVPDERVKALAKIFSPEREVYTTIRFVDIAGLVRGASKGEGLGNQFLGHIREGAAVAHVVRCFSDDNVTHVEGKIDPLADIATIHTELCLKDLETVNKRLDRARKQSKGGDPVEKLAVPLCERLSAHLDQGKPARTFEANDKETVNKRLDRARKQSKGGDPVEKLAVPLCERLSAHLDQGKPARTFEANDKESEIVRELQLLTHKPMFYVGNVAETALGNLEQDAHYQKLVRYAAAENAPVVPICAAIEAQIAELEPADRPEFLASVGLSEPGLNTVIRTGYSLLGLITFLTAGKQECRAWTVRKGATAPQAAGVIHTDFERGFIKAEVIWWEDLVALGSEAKCREAGKLAIEGRDYVVRDGDVIHFRFNV